MIFKANHGQTWIEFKKSRNLQIQQIYIYTPKECHPNHKELTKSMLITMSGGKQPQNEGIS